jgi:DNA-binding transcriptional regulator YiaG
MAIRAYDKLYIEGAQNVLGHAVDFAVMSLNLEPDTFGNAFAVSDSSRQFAIGNPRYVAGMNGCELARKVLSETGIPFTDTEDAMFLDKTPEYWAGWALAYYQWYSCRSFSEILTTVSLEEIIRLYHPYHEMDIRQFGDHMDELIQKAKPTTNLKMLRQQNGLSQRQLAELSGVPLRTIQQYEQRQKNINHAQINQLAMMAQALNCDTAQLSERI